MKRKENSNHATESAIWAFLRWFIKQLLEGYAEFYSAELSEKIHRGQKENALKGKNNGGGIPLGYLLDKKSKSLLLIR